MRNLKQNQHAQPDDFSYYQALISSINDAVISVDINFIILSWNAAAEKLYGIKAEEAIGKKSIEFLNIQYLTTSRKEALESLVKNNFWKGRIKITNSYNQPLYLQTSITTVKNKEGEKIGYVAVHRNITNELQQQQSLKNFTSILTLLEESFLIVDKDLNITFLRAKGNLEQFFGADFKVGDYALKYVLEPFIDEVKGAYEKAFKGETVQFINEPYNSTYFFVVTYAPLKDDLGNVDYVCLIIKDLTAQKEIKVLEDKKADVEKKLSESHNLFHEFMQKSPLLTSVVDEEGIIHHMNNPYKQLSNILNDTVNKSIFDIFPKDVAEEYHIKNKKVIEENKIFETVEEGENSANLRTYKVVRFPLHYNDKIMCAAWTVDISDQTAIQQMLLKLNEHKDKLVSIIAHDLRGPLGINASFLKSIVDDFNHYNKNELLTSLQLLTKSTAKSFSLVDDMLRWAKGQLSQINFNPKNLNIQSEILKVVDNIWDQLREKNITIETEFNYDDNIFVDHDMFSIIIRNLITNAIKFSYPDSIIFVKTNLHTDDKAIIIVEDNGTGMKKELIAKLLEKKNFESSYGTKGESGTGLGLIIAKDYIEKNGGQMMIESVENQGSKFCFTVPIANNKD